MIGQFCGPYFTVQPGKFEKSFFSAQPINLKGIINILPTSFYQSVLQVTDPHFFLLTYGPPAWAIHKLEKTWYVIYSMDLKLG